jgi:hypothetical protein
MDATDPLRLRFLLYLDTLSEHVAHRTISRGQLGKACCKITNLAHVRVEEKMDFGNGLCQFCQTPSSPLMKLSLGKDFFGRPYDRLSPLSDQNPKWYCSHCSLHKNLQRDFHDISTEFDKLRAGQASELSKVDAFRRASLRLQEIMTILRGSRPPSPFLSDHDVMLLRERLNTLTMPV